jgi:amylovoran biosynthesis glycosyltransferase AmsD
MKKVVFVIYSMEKAGGSERVVANIANQLSSDADLQVFIIPLYGAVSYFKISDSVHFSPLTADSAIGLLRRGQMLISRLNTLLPDCLVGISIGKLNTFLAACSVFFNFKTKLIASEHIAFASAGKLNNIIKSIAYRKFDSIAVLTNHDLQMMKEKGFRNIHLIRNASSYFPDVFSLTPILNRAKVILAIGRLEAQKGFDLLIEAWKKVYKVHPEWTVLIVGEGSLEEDLQQLTDHYFENSNACKIMPFSNKIDQLYGNCQLLALSSRFEGFPMVLIESMCFGVPAVSFDCETGPREIIKDLSNGMLVTNGDVDQMSKALSKLIADESLRSSLSSQCYKDRDDYNLDNIVGQWKALLA